MMERSRSSPDIIGILQKQNTALRRSISGVSNRDHSVPNWVDLVLINSWVRYSIGEPSAQYWRDSSGIVRLRGIVKSGTSYPNNMFNPLPEGFRPGNTARFPVVANSVFGYFQVLPTGEAQLVSGSNTWVDLSSISYRAEN